MGVRILAVALILIGLAFFNAWWFSTCVNANADRTSAASETSLTHVVNSIEYICDPQTEICFAIYRDGNQIAMTQVDVESVPAEMLKKATAKKKIGLR